MKTNENSLQTATRWAGNGAKLVYAGWAAHTVLFPRQRAPKASRAKRLEEMEENEETFDSILTARKDLNETIKEALAVTLADEDAYVDSAEDVVYAISSIQCDLSVLSTEDYFPGAKKAQCKKLEAEMAELLGVWNNILATRKHQAYLAEEAFQVKIGAKTPFDSWYDQSLYTLRDIQAVVAWIVVLGFIALIGILAIYVACGGTLPQ